MYTTKTVPLLGLMLGALLSFGTAHASEVTGILSSPGLTSGAGHTSIGTLTGSVSSGESSVAIAQSSGVGRGGGGVLSGPLAVGFVHNTQSGSGSVGSVLGASTDVPNVSDAASPPVVVAVHTTRTNTSIVGARHKVLAVNTDAPSLSASDLRAGVASVPATSDWTTKWFWLPLLLVALAAVGYYGYKKYRVTY